MAEMVTLKKRAIDGKDTQVKELAMDVRVG